MIQIYYIKNNRMERYLVATKEHAVAICKLLIESKALIVGISDENGESIINEIQQLMEDKTND